MRSGCAHAAWLSTAAFLGAGGARAEPLTFHAALDLADKTAPSVESKAKGLDAARTAAVPAGHSPDPKVALGRSSPMARSAPFRPLTFPSPSSQTWRNSMLNVEVERITCRHFLQASTQALKTLAPEPEMKANFAAAASIADSSYIAKNI